MSQNERLLILLTMRGAAKDRPWYGANQTSALTDEDRFWQKVKVGPGCWEWLGAIGSKGYGVANFGGRSRKTHRLMWELTFGPVENGLHVCHACDNPPCVRPTHLYLATNSQNIQDAFDRGLMPQRDPEKYGKLTRAQVAEIRRRRATGERRDEVAAAFGINESTVWRITSRRQWT